MTSKYLDKQKSQSYPFHIRHSWALSFLWVCVCICFHQKFNVLFLSILIHSKQFFIFLQRFNDAETISFNFNESNLFILVFVIHSIERTRKKQSNKWKCHLPTQIRVSGEFYVGFLDIFFLYNKRRCNFEWEFLQSTSIWNELNHSSDRTMSKLFSHTNSIGPKFHWPFEEKYAWIP